MSQDQNAGFDEKPDAVIDCETCAKIYAKHKYEFHDYAYNFTQSIIHASENYWEACIDTIPLELAGQYLEYLRDEVEACDYKPRLHGYLFVDDSLPYTTKQQELRPKYIALIALANKRLA